MMRQKCKIVLSALFVLLKKEICQMAFDTDLGVFSNLMK